MHRKVAITFAALVAIALAYFVSPPTAPAAWAQVHVGMNRAQVLTLVGPSPESGWPENITETWHRKRVLSQRRLFVLYEGDRVKEVCDGTWLRGYGWCQPRIETK
jgi:hypothetical protein